MTGAGMDDFFAAIDEARQEYETCVRRTTGLADRRSEYKPELERLTAERAKQREASKQEQLARLVKDMNVTGQTTRRPPDDEIDSDDDWDEGPDAARSEPNGPPRGQRRVFGGIEEDGLGARWPAPQ